ncbi:MAG TPA: hypothetical protein VG476_12600 [Acidimicrobiales bacterium]|nr:hypothetical protein [Acidimicrobiales bacterium]
MGTAHDIEMAAEIAANHPEPMGTVPDWTPAEWDAKWDELLFILQAFANVEHQGYQVVALASTDNHHESVVAQVLCDGVTEYDPEKGLYSDGKET